jgi:predicted TIM-barrel fold metal-dependent hydrolase
MSTYGPDWALQWIKTDNAIYDELALNDETRQKIYHKNAMRFFGPEAGHRA